ncbi:kinetochore protein NDC80 homolog [Tachypleus tridentatus]|uniref:kinetochore protein NDC80 homolog n=1 Tax=Tachypleus tridentatus TaxID=6853 RepID=UPI003FD4CA0B
MKRSSLLSSTGKTGRYFGGRSDAGNILPGSTQKNSNSVRKSGRSRTSSASNNLFGVIGGVRQRSSSASNSSGFNLFSRNRPGSVTGSTKVSKDPRPLSNRVYQSKSIHKLLEFLSDRQYSYQLSERLLSSPSTKDFVRIFEFLYGFWDSKYTASNRPEDEIPQLMKRLGYPFPIARSMLITIARHSWPSLLGVLVWLVELIMFCEQFNVTEMLWPRNNFEEEGINIKQVLFEHTVANYQKFMDNESDDIEEKEKFLRTLAERNFGGEKCLEMLREECEELNDKLMKKTDEVSTFKQMVQDERQLKYDITSFDQYFAQMKDRIDQRQAALPKLQEELQQKALEEEELALKVHQLQSVYQEQEFSAEDVEFFITLKNRLTQEVNDEKENIDVTRRETWELEIATGQLQSKLRNMCEDFNNKYEESSESVVASSRSSVGSINITSVHLGSLCNKKLPEFELRPSMNMHTYKTWMNEIGPVLKEIRQTVSDKILEVGNMIMNEQQCRNEFEIQATEQTRCFEIQESQLQEEQQESDVRKKHEEFEFNKYHTEYTNLQEQLRKERDNQHATEAEEETMLRNLRKTVEEKEQTLAAFKEECIQYLKAVAKKTQEMMNRVEEKKKQTCRICKDVYQKMKTEAKQ